MAGSDLAGLVRAAGAGNRMQPISSLLPKPLCPLMNRSMIDYAIDHVSGYCGDIAVNVYYDADRIVDYLDGRGLQLFREPLPDMELLGTLRLLESWRRGRDMLVVSADSWFETSLKQFVQAWDRRRPRLWVVRSVDRVDIDGWFFVGVALLPAKFLSQLPPTWGNLFDTILLPMWKAGELDIVVREEPFIECGTPEGYLELNLHMSGGLSVIGPRSKVNGTVVRSILWPDSSVGTSEILFECLRVGADVTIPLTQRAFHIGGRVV